MCHSALLHIYRTQHASAGAKGSPCGIVCVFLLARLSKIETTRIYGRSAGALTAPVACAEKAVTGRRGIARSTVMHMTRGRQLGVQAREICTSESLPRSAENLFNKIPQARVNHNALHVPRWTAHVLQPLQDNNTRKLTTTQLEARARLLLSDRTKVSARSVETSSAVCSVLVCVNIL